MRLLVLAALFAAVKSNDPVVDPTDPVDPGTDPVDPVDPVDPGTDPVDPVDPGTDPVDPVDPTDPVDPGTDPVDGGGTEPTEETEPVDETVYVACKSDTTRATGVILAAVQAHYDVAILAKTSDVEGYEVLLN